MSSRSPQWSASSMTWLETMQGRAAVGQAVELVPQIDPQHGVEPDGRFVEHQQVRM